MKPCKKKHLKKRRKHSHKKRHMNGSIKIEGGTDRKKKEWISICGISENTQLSRTNNIEQPKNIEQRQHDRTLNVFLCHVWNKEKNERFHNSSEQEKQYRIQVYSKNLPYSSLWAIVGWVLLFLCSVDNLFYHGALLIFVHFYLYTITYFPMCTPIDEYFSCYFVDFQFYTL